MSVEIVYYLDVVSSWCYWAEPAWAELKRRYANAPVTFDWKIALLDESGMSKSRQQAEWSCIADRAAFSGVWRLDPLIAAIEAILADATAYASWKAHIGDPPPG